jgi:SAM-dependent methyltransferase
MPDLVKLGDPFAKDWDSYSDLIDSRKESKEWAVLRAARESHWDEFFALGPTHDVLDAGCGNGDYTVLALATGARVWAFDLAPRMVENARRRVSRRGMACEELRVASVVDIPYPDESFDVVMCLAVVDHVPDPMRQRAFDELSRVLRPDGEAYVNVPNRFAYHWRGGHWLMCRLGRFPHGKIRFMSPSAVRRHVQAAGLEARASMGLEFVPPFSGIYTTDLRRLTVLPASVSDRLDRVYLRMERWARRKSLLKPLCLHYFLRAHKPARPLPGASSGTKRARPSPSRP